MYPRLTIDLEGLFHNAKRLSERCHALGISVAAVTKVFCADRRMVEVLARSPVDYLADSRLENFGKYPETDKKKLLLRLPMPSEAMRTVRLCDMSLNSEIKTLGCLSGAAEALGKRHGVILMVDMGDLREGIYYDHYGRILETAEYALSKPGLELLGMGLNLTCYGSVIPTPENLGRFCGLVSRVKEHFGVEFPIVSGGNSSSLYLMRSGTIPSGITNLRIGEAIVRGIETAYQQPVENLQTDIVTLEAEIIELQEKPSMPEGQTGLNAFGEKNTYTDIGRRMRAIVAVGRQDTELDGLSCLEDGVTTVGASSDHLIVDVTGAGKKYAVGDILRFSLSYSAILRGFTSPYVKRVYKEPRPDAR